MTLLHDLRIAARSLRRTPGLVLVAVASLGLGIAAVTTLWAGVDTMLFRPLAYDPEGELVFVGTREGGRGSASSPTAAADFLDLRASATTLSLAAYRDAGVNLGGDPAEWVRGRRVSGNFFDVLGIRPAAGRLFTMADERPGSAEVAVLSHGLWQRRFGGRADAVGTTIDVDGVPATIVGILPEGFEFGFDSPDLWLQLWFADPPRDARTLSVIGRREADATAVRAELASLAAGLAETHPETDGDRTFLAGPLFEEWFGGRTFRQGAWAALTAAALVLLVACANVANLLLARGATRADEIAVRRSLGAGRLRVVRQLLTEAGLLAAMGGALGILLSVAGLRGLTTIMPIGMPRASEVTLDGRALALGMIVSLGSVLVFGLVPALRTVRGAPPRVGGARSDAIGGGRNRLRNVLVGAEVALALVLLATTALVIRSVGVIRAVDTGFRTEDVVTFALNLPHTRYPDEASRQAAATRLEEALAAMPGVESAGVGVGVPARGWRSERVRTAEAAEDEARTVVTRFASPGYLATLGLTPVRGRPLDLRDDVSSAPVALVNERLAEWLWAGEDPVGRQLRVGDRLVAVVGVVPDAREWGPTFDPVPTLYLPLAQWPPFSRLDFVLAGPDDRTLIAGARLAISRVDPFLAMHGESSLENVLMGPAEQFTSFARLLSVLAGAAVLLAVIGVYGSMAYAVARRVPEIGVRMAIGADAAAIRRMILGDAGRVAITGMVIGLILALGAARGVGSFLFGVRATDPLAFLAAPLLLLAVSLAAAWVPARRASRVDPMRSLRAE